MSPRGLRPPTHWGLCGLARSEGCPASHTPPKLWHQVLEMDQESTIDSEFRGLSFGCITHYCFVMIVWGSYQILWFLSSFVWACPLPRLQVDGSWCHVVIPHGHCRAHTGTTWSYCVHTCFRCPYCHPCCLWCHFRGTYPLCFADGCWVVGDVQTAGFDGIMAGPLNCKKHGKKEPQSFSHCGSFDHHARQSLNNCIFVFLDLPTDTLGILGLVIYHWKGLESTFPTVYHTPQNI